MAFSYCPHCGYKNMYSMQAPKFCGGCGETLNILSAAKRVSVVPEKKTVSRPIRARQEIVDDPDGTDVFDVPNITKLSYSIEKDNNKFSLKDMIPLEEIQEFQENDQPRTPKKAAKKRGRPKKS
ncbi:MAG: hypothetical protein CL833_01035 [Crocinitomicaceae bacterium]|nr:hypothetical protein [Crocinitomicaceae bacterium]|tara:strand:- start:238 stop:609 length:372 start_codon:yes stop_codon:yes gene_type:complete